MIYICCVVPHVLQDRMSMTVYCIIPELDGNTPPSLLKTRFTVASLCVCVLSVARILH